MIIKSTHNWSKYFSFSESIGSFHTTMHSLSRVVVPVTIHNIAQQERQLWIENDNDDVRVCRFRWIVFDRNHFNSTLFLFFKISWTKFTTPSIQWIDSLAWLRFRIWEKPIRFHCTEKGGGTGYKSSKRPTIKTPPLFTKMPPLFLLLKKRHM